MYCDGSKVYLYLSASTYTSVSDVHANLDGTEFYYVLSAPQYYDVINQYDLHNLSMRQLKIGKELSVKDTEISVQVDYSQSFYYTESSMFDVLPNNTVKIAYENDNIVLRYYDINGNILGFSDIMVENGIYTIPNNVYYVSIMDLECYEQYQYSFKDDAGVSNGDIEDLFLTVDDVETEIALPHILHPGDELYYDIDHEVWTYYPRSANGMYIVYDDFAKIAINGNISCQEGLILGACVSCISIRNLERPDNIIIYDEPHTGDFGFGYVTFDEVAGATSYDIYINDEFVENFENADDIERFDFESEQKGDLYIVAKNDDAESVNSKEKYIVTVPNTPILGSVDTIYENNRYYITIQFNANSRIANTYDVIYSLDGSNEVTEVMVHDKVYNSSKTFTFTAPTITDSFTVLLAASNETGRNDYQSSVTLVTNSGFDIWTYKKNDNHVLMAWTDEFTDEDGYVLKYSINNGEWQTYISDGDIGSGNRLSEYIPLGQNETMRICLAVLRNGYTNIYSRPIVVSMALDTTLLPPANFTGTKTDSGNIQFSWEDNYDVDIDYFELYYIYSDGDTQTVRISRQSEIAGNYTYVYSSDQYGFIQAKIKMVWELGESDYTQDLIIYNIPTVETAPSLTSKSRAENRLKITWEIYDYIQKYTLYLTVNGEQEIINTNDNEYYYNIPMDQSIISVNVAVQATFIDDSYTNISDSLSFNICNSSYEYRSVIYTHNEDEHKLYTTMLSRGLYTSYRDYMISTNKYTIEYPYIEKMYLRYLFRDYILHEMYWGHNVGASYLDNVLIVNSSMQTYNINVKIYTKETLDNRLLSILYSKCENSYPIYTSITKLIIACFGDSITAGHPNYWAKFNPYVEKSA